ncbi:MAG: restriction endonuclease subunit S [Bacteroidota bacterium]
MSEWRVTYLKEIAEIDMGQSPKGQYCNSYGDGTPLLNGPTEFGTRSPNPVQFTIDPKKISIPDDLLFCVRGSTTGKMNWSDQPYAIGRGVAAIRHRDGAYYNRYIKSLLEYNLSTLLSSASGSTFPNISKNQLEELEVFLPPLKTQKSIASILSSLDDKIDLLHRQNKTLEQLAETLFRQWFVEEAKEGWEVVKLEDFGFTITDYVANGSFAALAENVNYKSEPDYSILIRLTDYNNSFSGDFVFVDKHAYDFLSKSSLEGGEVIISNVGAYSGTVFKCPRLNRPMTLGPNSIVLKSNTNNFFFLYFKSPYGQFQLDGIISGSAQPKFNKSSFRKIEVQLHNLSYIE